MRSGLEAVLGLFVYVLGSLLWVAVQEGIPSARNLRATSALWDKQIRDGACDCGVAQAR